MPSARLRPGLVSALLLAVGFVAVHAFLAWTDLAPLGIQPAGDVTGVYRFWVDYWRDTGVLVGVDTAWVYPIAALPPMLLAGLLGDAAYLPLWIVLVVVLDAAALVLLARRSVRLAWWWLAFAALLGPVTLVRIDAVALPLAIAGVLALERRPWLASALWTLAAWVKVWPAALVAALLLAGRRIAGSVAAAALTSAAVLGVAVAFGARGSLFSFIAAQATRGLQVEAPIALPWLWTAALGDPAVQVYYDTDLLTYQLRGGGVAQVAAVMTPVLAIAVLAVVGLALAARLRGAEPRALLALTALGLVAAVIALNKVGSPQYLTWYVAPVLLGLLAVPRPSRVPAVLVLVAAGLTQVVYPWRYGEVIDGVPWALALLTVRNLLELALLGWALVALARLRPATDGVPAAGPGTTKGRIPEGTRP